MTTHTFVGAIDQGTTGTRFIVFDREGAPVGRAYARHEQSTPEPNRMEQDANSIWECTKSVVREGLRDAAVDPEQIAAIGIANQRETALLWDASTGEPLGDAIGWRDRRATERFETTLDAEGHRIRRITGLQPDPYFSAAKLTWLLERGGEEGSRDLHRRAEAGELRFGTIDSWLVYNLTGRHVTDVTNASRTMLFDIDSLSWSERLCAAFDVPMEVLPSVCPSSDPNAYGETDSSGFLGASVPVTAAMGDQQASLFGQACFEPGEAKNTYGSGSFLLASTGRERVRSENGLIETIGFQRAGGDARYALEGPIFEAGSALEWLSDVSLLTDITEIASAVQRVDSSEGVYVVPAFSGLGAPQWDARARGTILGLTRETRREHVLLATLESIAYRVRDVVSAVEADLGDTLSELRVDGAATRNDYFCQMQADLVARPVVRPQVDATNALGAAYAAGLAVGYWPSLDALREVTQRVRRFSPQIDTEIAARKYERWTDAVERAMNWERER
ncbi:glycerol kinase GlpK [Halobellus captivus]|uniref:glycerol kinase GlpK n=1 Tax=Halobellus captivus TaxID=2592614 RepID=UPI0011A0063B|nr:glycerol kinase GlpK [Halobellus captivus]